MHQVLAAGASVVIVLETVVVVLLAGSAADQEKALEAAARFPSELDSIRGLPDGRDVAVFSRDSNSAQITTRREKES